MAQTYGALTENIVLLALLGSTFEPITGNSLPDVSTADGRRLSLKHEIQIADAFAVLLVDTDDPSAVGAVCVEELDNTAGILIRTAVNTGNQKERMSNFNRIARALMNGLTLRKLQSTPLIKCRSGREHVLGRDYSGLPATVVEPAAFNPFEALSKGRQTPHPPETARWSERIEQAPGTTRHCLHKRSRCLNRFTLPRT